MNLESILFYLGMSVSREKRPFEFTGSLAANTQAAYNQIVWNDSRPKPTWQTVFAASEYSVLWHAKRAWAAGI